jgi:hypothetical protein
MPQRPPGGHRLKLTPRALDTRESLERFYPARFKKLQKALQLLKTNPAHPGLNAHKYDSLRGQAPDGGDMWVAYIENNTPSAWRIFYFYDRRDPGVIFVTSIEPHS